MSEMKNTDIPAIGAKKQLPEVVTLTHEQLVQLYKSLPAPAPTGMSAEIEQLATALAMAKGQMFSPIRNKHVTVKRKKGGEYDFRYTSLDVINDMMRLPLFENGLSTLHIMRPNARGSLFMATRLLHKSGQWMDSVLPIQQADASLFEDDVITGPQRLGSLITFAKRYNLCALFDIAAQDDDDANAAEGNLIIDHEYPVEPQAQLRVLQDRYARLVSAAANARDPAGIGEVLQRWQRGMEFWDRMRTQGDTENWSRLMELIPAALGRVHDKILGTAFLDAATATRKGQIDDLRVLWESPDGQAARSAMKALNSISYGMLFEHLRMQTARVEREEEEAEARLRQQVEQAALATALRDEASPFDGGSLEQLTAAGPDMTFRHVRDEFGEIVTDELTSESDWAKAYVQEWLQAESRVALREHNADGLAWAERVTEGQVVLMQGLGTDRFAQAETPPAVDQAPQEAPSPAAPEALEPAIADDPRQLALLPDVAVVALHRTPRGTPDLIRYVRAVKVSLDQVEACDLARWEETNLPTVDGLPRGTQLEIMGVLARRRQTLGVAA